MKRKILLTAVLASGFLFVGCAQKAIEKQVDQKLAQEVKVKSEQELRAEADQMILSSNLKEEQKIHLLETRKNWTEKSMELRDESLRLRSLLLKDLLNPAYNQKEVQVIQKRLKKNEQKRVALFLESIRKTDKILGRAPNAEDRKKAVGNIFESREFHMFE